MTIPDRTPEQLSRRDFVSRAGLGLAAAWAIPNVLNGAAEPVAQPVATTPAAAAPANGAFEIAAFEKHFFESYTPAELTQTCDEMDLHVELTVRPEGHIKPVNAAEELPVMVDELAKRRRRILVIATSFVRPDEPHIESTLRAAHELGIRYFRHRGFSYVTGTPIKEQVASFRSQAREFAAMSKAIGVTALYQNHAGADAVGAAIWDIDEVLDDIEPRYFGLALDTRHLLVELGRAWPTAVRMISPRVQSLYVKSFRWERDRTIETPLSEGIVTKAVIDEVLAGHGSLPVCLHVEHLKLEPVPFAERAATVEAFRSDARILRSWLPASV